jgi:hypothetical protein
LSGKVIKRQHFTRSYIAIFKFIKIKTDEDEHCHKEKPNMNLNALQYIHFRHEIQHKLHITKLWNIICGLCYMGVLYIEIQRLQPICI